MAGSSAFAVWAFRSLVRHTGPEIAAGNFWNALGAPVHAGKFAAIGIPGYYTSALLFSNGLETARLNSSATSMAIRHCKDLFPNSR